MEFRQCTYIGSRSVAHQMGNYMTTSNAALLITSVGFFF
jgi:hypothetical protein